MLLRQKAGSVSGTALIALVRTPDQHLQGLVGQLNCNRPRKL
jgi:hypothetical protein